MWSVSARSFSKIGGIFDSRRPVTKAADQGTVQWEQYIWGQICESIYNQQQKTGVVEYLSGVYQLGSARKIFEKSEEDRSSDQGVSWTV